MIISSSSSFPDLNAHSHSTSPNPTTSSHRIPRKPAPTIDIDIIAERYPSPDPSDPFAPLWALRNRTSSILPATHGVHPYSGAYDSQETLANLVEVERRRRRTYSYDLLSSPYSGDSARSAIVLQPDLLGDTDSLTCTSLSGSNLSSPLGSPVKVSPSTTTANNHQKTKPSKASATAKSKGPTKKGHYTPYSQTQAHTRVVFGPDACPAAAHSTTLLHAFPRISTPSLPLPQLQTHSPPSDHRHNPRLVPVRKKNSSSDTDTDSTYTNSNSKAQIASLSPAEWLSSTQHNSRLDLVRPHTSGGSPGNGWWFSRSKSSNDPSLDLDANAMDETHQKYKRSQSALGHFSTNTLAHPPSATLTQPQSDPKNVSEQGQGGAPGKFVKFLKISLLRNGDKVLNSNANNKRPSTDPGVVNSRSRSRPRLRPMSKASISAPQAVISTAVFWDPEPPQTSDVHDERFHDIIDLSRDGIIPGEWRSVADELDVDVGVDVEAVNVPVATASRMEGDGTEMTEKTTTTNMTNKINFMTNTTNATKMNTTNLDGDQKRQGYDDDGQETKDVSRVVSTNAVVDGAEFHLDHGERDHKALETNSIPGSGTAPNANSAAQKKHDNDDDSDFNDISSHESRSKKVLHSLTINEVTDRPISADDDGGLIVLGCNTVQARRRYSLDIIDGYGAPGTPIAPPTPSTQQMLFATPDGAGAQRTTNASATGKKRSKSFFRVMTKTMKPNGPRPNTTEGRLQALTTTTTAPTRDLHRDDRTSVLQPLRRDPARMYAASTSISTPSFSSNPSYYTSPRAATQPPAPSASAITLGKGKSSFLFMKKSSSAAVDLKGDGELRHDAGRKKRRSRKNGKDDGNKTSESLAGRNAFESAAPSMSDADLETRGATVIDHINVHTHSSEGEGFNVNSFSTEWTLPNAPQLTFAASLPLTTEEGTQVSFGSLFASTRTIVIFIRHFWCPLCQDYMTSFKSLVRPEMLARWPEGATDEEAEELRKKLVKFVVVSNGAHGMIGKYRRIFGLPFKVYTDPELRIYRALGMGRDRSGSGGVEATESCARHAGDSGGVGRCDPSLTEGPRGGRGLESEDELKPRISGGYVKHGLVGGIAMVVVRAIKVGMPVWEKGGDVGQLGGEFIFGPGLSCTYAHRMQHTRGHAPIEDVLTAAGIDVASLVVSTSLTTLSSAHPENVGTIHPSEPTKEEKGNEVAVVSSASHFISDTPRKGPSTIAVAPDQPRPSLSSLKGLKGPISLSRAASVASAMSVSLIQKSLHGGGTPDAGVVAPSLAEGIVEMQSKRQTRRYSLGFDHVDGMMSREEEERWMASRQASIERLREKKDMRRGILRSRTVSVESSGAAAAAAAAAAGISVASPDSEEVVVIQPERLPLHLDSSAARLEVASPSLSVVMMVGNEVAGEGHEVGSEDEEMTPTGTRRPLSVNGDWVSDGLGLDDDGEEGHNSDSESESDCDITPNPSLSRLVVIGRQSSDSLSDTASSWSRNTAPLHDGGSFVFTHDVVL